MAHDEAVLVSPFVPIRSVALLPTVSNGNIWLVHFECDRKNVF